MLLSAPRRRPRVVSAAPSCLLLLASLLVVAPLLSRHQAVCWARGTSEPIKIRIDAGILAAVDTGDEGAAVAAEMGRYECTSLQGPRCVRHTQDQVRGTGDGGSDVQLMLPFSVSSLPPFLSPVPLLSLSLFQSLTNGQSPPSSSLDVSEELLRQVLAQTVKATAGQNVRGTPVTTQAPVSTQTMRAVEGDAAADSHPAAPGPSSAASTSDDAPLESSSSASVTVTEMQRLLNELDRLLAAAAAGESDEVDLLSDEDEFADLSSAELQQFLAEHTDIEFSTVQEGQRGSEENEEDESETRER